MTSFGKLRVYGITIFSPSNFTSSFYLMRIASSLLTSADRTKLTDLWLALIIFRMYFFNLTSYVLRNMLRNKACTYICYSNLKKLTEDMLYVQKG